MQESICKSNLEKKINQLTQILLNSLILKDYFIHEELNDFKKEFAFLWTKLKTRILIRNKLLDKVRALYEPITGLKNSNIL